MTSVKEAFDVNQTIHGTVPGIPAAAGPMTGGQARLPGAPEMPGLRLMIGVDGDPREWGQVAYALLERIASGAVRAGSRGPPDTHPTLGTAGPPPGARPAKASCTGCHGSAITSGPASPLRSAAGRARTAG